MVRKIYFKILLGCVVIFLVASPFASASALPELFDNWSSDSASSRIFGKSTTTWASKVSFKYTPTESFYLCEVDWRMKIGSGTPSDEITLTISTGGSNPDNGAWVLDTWTNNDTPSSTWAWINFGEGENCQNLTGGVAYFLTLSRETLSDTDYYYTQHGASGSGFWSYYLGAWHESFTANPFAVRGYGIGGVTTGLDDIDNPLEEKFPFSWIYDLQDIFEVQGTSSTSSFPTLSFSVGTSSLPIEVTFLSTSTIGKFMGSNYTVFYNLMKWAVWLGFALYIYKRITHLRMK